VYSLVEIKSTLNCSAALNCRSANKE